MLLLPGEAMHRLTDEPRASNEASGMGLQVPDT